MYVRTVALIIGLIAALAALAGPASAGTPLPDQRIDMRVLLLSADGNEPGYQAWRAQLEREGVPFDAIVATQAAPITYAQLADGKARARYQAVILATGGLVYFDGTSYVSALEASEWDAINEFERTFGIRQVTAFVYPSPAYGLNSPTVGSSMAGIVGSLTPAAQPLFGYLKGQVAFDGNAWGYQATPVNPASFRTFVSGPNGSSLVGAYTHPDGREELVVTVDSNPWMIHSQLLRHGMLSWATRGVYLGAARDYLELQIDDVFLPDDRWDMATNTTPEESPRPIRMTALDVLRAATWQASTGMRLDLVYNGFGGESSRDHAARTLISMRGSFRWTNHTYEHENLDNLSLAELKNQIQANIDFAHRKGLAIDATELVTGEHSGLNNPNLAQALNETGIRWVAADNSRQPTPYGIGNALTVPRHPTNVFYNVGAPVRAARRVQLHLPPAAGRHLPEHGGHHVPHDADHVVGVRPGRGLDHVQARHGQRSAAPHVPPVEPGRGRRHVPGHQPPPVHVQGLLQDDPRAASPLAVGRDHAAPGPLAAARLERSRLRVHPRRPGRGPVLGCRGSAADRHDRRDGVRRASVRLDERRRGRHLTFNLADPGEHGRTEGHRHAEGGSGAHRDERHLERHGTAHVHLPVAALRERRLHLDPGRCRADVHGHAR